MGRGRGRGKDTCLEGLSYPEWAPVPAFLSPHEGRGQEGDWSALCLRSPGTPGVLKGEGHVLTPQDLPMTRSWAQITDGLATALDQCLGGLPYLLLQKPDALQPVHLSGGLPAGGEGWPAYSTEINSHAIPRLLQGAVPSSPRV